MKVLVQIFCAMLLAAMLPLCSLAAEGGAASADSSNQNSTSQQTSVRVAEPGSDQAIPSPEEVNEQSTDGTYEVVAVDTLAQAETDGTLHVIEQRQVKLDAPTERISWPIDLIWGTTRIQINSLRAMVLDENGQAEGEWITLADVSFRRDWREAGGPNGQSFAYVGNNSGLSIFFNQDVSRVLFELDYSLADGVQIYEDAAQVYWRYVPTRGDLVSNNVTTTVVLPVPASVTNAGEYISAWGHGPEGSEVVVNPEGSILYVVPQVMKGQYAEARIVFPKAWISHASAESAQAHHGEYILDSSVREEAQWTDRDSHLQSIATSENLILIVVCGVVVLGALVLFLCFGREHHPAFTDRYSTELPDPKFDPALIGRLWRWNRPSPDDLVASIVELSNRGLVKLQVAEGQPGQEMNDYELVGAHPLWKQTWGCQRRTLRFLLSLSPGDQFRLRFADLRKMSVEDPQRLSEAYKLWQKGLGADVDSRGWFDRRSFTLQMIVGTLSGIAALLTLLSLFFGSRGIPTIALGITTVALGVLANYMPRRSVEGNELIAHAKALRNWLRDISERGGAPISGEDYWKSALVYAYLFNEEDSVVSYLNETKPSWIRPLTWQRWYLKTQGANQVPMPPAVDLLSANLEEALARLAL